MKKEIIEPAEYIVEVPYGKLHDISSGRPRLKSLKPFLRALFSPFLGQPEQSLHEAIFIITVEYGLFDPYRNIIHNVQQALRQENPAFLQVQLSPDSSQTYSARITDIHPLALQESGIQYLLYSVIASEELLTGLKSSRLQGWTL